MVRNTRRGSVPERRRRLRHRRHIGPDIARLPLPWRTTQREKRHAQLAAGLRGIARDDRREGMRRVDHAIGPVARQASSSSPRHRRSRRCASARDADFRSCCVRPASDSITSVSGRFANRSDRAEASAVPPRMRMRMCALSTNRASLSSGSIAPWLSIVGIGEDGRAGLSACGRCRPRRRRLCHRWRAPPRAGGSDHG